MVIPTSDSNSTLVSLGNNNRSGGLKRDDVLRHSPTPTTTTPQEESYSYSHDLFVASALLAPLDNHGVDIDDECFSEDMDDDSDDCDYSCGGGGSSSSSDSNFFNCYDAPLVDHHHHHQQQQQPIYLPHHASGRSARDDLGVDECLKYIPEIMERCDELLAVEPVRFTKSSPESVLYVAQGEVAHAVPSQC
jgi:hypothetical protein